MEGRSGSPAIPRWCLRDTAIATPTVTSSRAAGTSSYPAASAPASHRFAWACRRRSSSSSSGGPHRLPDDDPRAGLDPVVEIDHVDVAHPDAARRHGPPDLLGLVGAVDLVERVLVAFEQIEG